MSKYVRNADLTVEYIVLRAFQLGAIQVYSDTRQEYHKQIVTIWPNHEIIAFPMEDYFLENGWNMNFANNLPSFRRSIENHGYYMKHFN